MASPNAAKVREVLQAFAERDRRRLDAALERTVHPDFVMDLSTRLIEPQVYRGHEGVRRFHEQTIDVWAEMDLDTAELHEAGERLLSLVAARGRGRESGLEISTRIALLWELRQGKLARMTYFGERFDEARAGLEA